MRNLKRALSLALASVMLLGMMVVGSSAVSYPDVTDEENVEAIAVLNAVEVMIGNENGEFEPDKNVTRNEMAVILAKLILGSEADKYVGTCPFTDVPEWAQKYVAACYDNKIVAGRSESIYDGNAVVTAQEAAAMTLRVLGYEKLESTGTNWAQPVVAKANEIRLFKDVGSSATAPLDRNQVAQLALNALQADVVNSEVDKDIIVEGVVTIPGKVTYKKVEAKASDPKYDDVDDKVQQLCEKLYGTDLKLDTGDNDGMGRPANTWSYKSDDVVKAAQEADRVIVVDKAQTLAKEIEDANKNWKLSWTVTTDEGTNTVNTTVTVNGGDSATSVKVKVGDVLEIYMHGSIANAVETIAITQYSVDEVTGAVVTKGSGDDLQIRIPGFVGYTDADKLNGDYNALEKDDIIYYYKDSDGVYTFAKADSFEGTYTGTKSGTPLKMIIDGSNYVENGNVAVINSTTDKNASYTFYTDANGYLIASKKNEETSKDYVVIQDIRYAQGTGGITGSEAVEARLVKMDGTAEVVKVNAVKIGGTNYIVGDSSNNLISSEDVHSTVKAEIGKAFFTYSINSDKEYELTKVAVAGNITHNEALDDNGAVIKTGEASMTNVSGVAVNKNTVFVVATESGGKSFKVYNGIGEVPKITLDGTGSNNKCAYITENNIATYVYVGSYSSSEVDGDTVFFLKNTPETTMTEKVGDDTIYYKTYKAIVDGEYRDDVKVKTNSGGVLVSDVNNLAVALFTPAYDDNDLITKLTASNKDVAGAVGYKLDGGILMTKGGNGDTYTCADDAPVFIMDKDGNVTEGAASDITEDENDSVYVIKTKDDNKVVDFLVIIEVDDDVVNVITGEPTTLPVEGGPTSSGQTNKPGDVEQKLQGSVEAGIPSGEAATSLDMGDKMNGKKITTSYIEIPAGTYGIRQTNALFTDADVFTNGQNGHNTTAGTKTKKYEIGTADKLYFMIGENTTVTFAFDWDYTGEGEHATFEADYTITVSSAGLTINKT